MILSEEFERLLRECEDSSFIKENTASLKAFFSKTENLNMLKHTLTTSRNGPGLRIAKCLGLRVMPFLDINQNTYTSIYWLYKFRLIEESDFLAMKAKFEDMANSEEMFDSVENGYILAKMEERRKLQKEMKTPAPIIDLRRMRFKRVTDMVYVINIDDLINWSADKNINVNCKFKTLDHKFPNIPREISNSIIKMQKMVENKIKKLGERGYKYNSLTENEKYIIKTISSSQIKLLRHNVKCYLMSKRSLDEIISIKHSYFYDRDLKHLISCSNEEIKKIHRRVLIFGKEGISISLLKLSVQNALLNFKDKRKDTNRPHNHQYDIDQK